MKKRPAVLTQRRLTRAGAVVPPLIFQKQEHEVTGFIKACFVVIFFQGFASLYTMILT